MKTTKIVIDTARFAAECTCGDKFTVVAPPSVVAGVKRAWEARHTGAGHKPVAAAAAIGRNAKGRSTHGRKAEPGRRDLPTAETPIAAAHGKNADGGHHPTTPRKHA